MERRERARVHAALGDEHRLHIVEELTLGDLSPAEIGEAVGLPSNLLAHHLGVLHEAGLITKRVSDADHRRRYVSLTARAWLEPPRGPRVRLRFVLFVCTHNAARSQFAEVLWRRRTAIPAESVGTHPARRVDSRAIQTAAADGLDLSASTPRGFDAFDDEPDLVVSVCDRAREADLPVRAERLHWSVPDPIEEGTTSAFRAAYDDISQRVERLAGALEPDSQGATIP
jgi:protein-tyrosine-phosphatase